MEGVGRTVALATGVIIGGFAHFASTFTFSTTDTDCPSSFFVNKVS